MKKHKLTIEGTLVATCSCGSWSFHGLPTEARKALEQLFRYHQSYKS